MDSKIKRYESLLNELGELDKECMHIYIEYIREFGDEINHIFSLKVDTITLKKKIAYCIKKQNNKEEILLEKMEESINKLIKNYKTELDKMIEYKNLVDSDKGKKITFDTKRSIKLMYYKIVHLIHPDLHPELQKNKKIKELWQSCVDSYKCNDIKALQRVYDKILILIDKNIDIVLNDIDEKIFVVEQEINEIKNNNPYKYKFILEDEDEMLNLHKKNREKEEYYLDYIKSLSNKLEKFPILKKKECDA